jgi:DNA-binding MarR family transcriptional regulator
MPGRSTLDEDVTTIRDAIGDLSRRMNHPKLQLRVKALAGVDIDKVGEIVLTTVERCGGTELRLSDVADRLGVELSSVSRKVQKLEEAGLLSRTTDPVDGRASRLRLTPEGQDVLSKIATARWSLVKEALSQWSDSDRQTFTELFSRFAADIFDLVENRSTS